MKFQIFLLSLFCAVPVMAQEPSKIEKGGFENPPSALQTEAFTTTKVIHRFTFNFGTEISQLQFRGGSLQGYGFNLGTDFALTDKIALGPAMGMVYDLTQFQGFLYSRFSGYAKYALTGHNYIADSTLSFKGASLMQKTTKPGQRLVLGVGADQLFLNGSKNIYPATGPSAMCGYSFVALGLWLDVSVSYGVLTANDLQVGYTALKTSIVFGM